MEYKNSEAWKALDAQGLADTPRSLGIQGCGLCYNRPVYVSFF